jgi:hypothetical protein
VRALDVRDRGADAAVRDVLWRLMELDIVQGLLVPLQTQPNEAPAPTLTTDDAQQCQDCGVALAPRVAKAPGGGDASLRSAGAV